MPQGDSEQIFAEYLAGRVPLDQAVSHFMALGQDAGPGFGVDLAVLDDAQRVMVEELFGRIFWCKMNGADPTTQPPAPFFAMLEEMKEQLEQPPPDPAKGSAEPE